MEDYGPVTFSVTYRLHEYLALIGSHVREKATPKNASWFRRLTNSLIVAVLGRVMFFVKSRRIGACDFVIDESGISRSSKQGQTLVPWSEVTALHAYEAGYIIEIKLGGGLPVPFRVLSQEQRERLSSLVAGHASAADAT